MSGGRARRGRITVRACPPRRRPAAWCSSSKTSRRSPRSSGSTWPRPATACTSSTTDSAALDAVRGRRPAAIILDVGLPGLDGIEMCRRLRADDDWTPVLFVTARDDEVDRIVGLEMGADDYVTKPFSPRELVARVTGVLRRTRGWPRPPRRRSARSPSTRVSGGCSAPAGRLSSPRPSSTCWPS